MWDRFFDWLWAEKCQYCNVKIERPYPKEVMTGGDYSCPNCNKITHYRYYGIWEIV
jgi:hypothetical protein